MESVGSGSFILIFLHKRHLKTPCGLFQRPEWPQIGINLPFAPLRTVLSICSLLDQHTYSRRTSITNHSSTQQFRQYPFETPSARSLTPMLIAQTTERHPLTTHVVGPEKDAHIVSGVGVVRRQLPTKHASPRRLSEELKHLLGQDADFNVEVGPSLPRSSQFSQPVQQVHHNVYMIESSQDFDLETLYLNCRQASMRGSGLPYSESD